MSTRGSIFYHKDSISGVEIHVYYEAASSVPNDIRIEIEFPHGLINAEWPHEAFLEELRRNPGKLFPNPLLL